MVGMNFENLNDFVDTRTNSEKLTQIIKQADELKLKFDLFKDNLQFPKLYKYEKPHYDSDSESGICFESY